MPAPLRISDLHGRGDKREYLRFLRSLYRGNPAWKDLQSHLARGFLDGADTFIRSCQVRPVFVREEGSIVGQAMLIVHPAFPALQVAFLECLRDRRDAVEAILDEARSEAARKGLRRIVVGLNGHVAYGVGFLENRFDEPISFDSLYTAPWLAEILDSFGMESATLSTYKTPLRAIANWDPDPVRARDGGYSIRHMDFARFDDEILLFGELANRFLAETPLYFPRDPVSLVELLRPMRPLLDGKNLLFAMHGGVETGFLFWHPDYNEVVPGGRAAGIPEIALRTWLLGRRIRNAKLNAVGISAEHRGGPALGLLLREVHALCAGGFDTVETNFVWDGNLESSNLNRRHLGSPHRRYRVRFIEVAA